MNHADLHLVRSLLFLPASNPRAIEKARSLPADLVVLDLEDAVKPEDKASARRAAIEAVSQGFDGRLVAIRMNALGSPWFGEDVVALRHCKASLVVMPKIEARKQIHDADRLLSRPVLAMVETPAGVLAAADIAHDAAALVAGVNDLSAGLRIPAGSGRAGLAHSLQTIVLAARAQGIPAFDGVCNALDDLDVLEAECREGRSYGFDGKSLIHPSQVETANRFFGPSDAEIAEAERLIAAASGGAERFEGRMIEALHVEQAEALLARAGR